MPVVLVLVGCSQGTPSAERATAEPGDRAAVLAAADAADGTTDHVVARCAVCGLGMDGVAEHAATFEGYTLYFCSAECRESFEANPKAILARLAKQR